MVAKVAGVVEVKKAATGGCWALLGWESGAISLLGISFTKKEEKL